MGFEPVWHVAPGTFARVNPTTRLKLVCCARTLLLQDRVVLLLYISTRSLLYCKNRNDSFILILSCFRDAAATTLTGDETLSMEAEESSRDQEVPESCSGTSARTATMSSNQPHMWSIPYTLLMEIEETAAQRFGTEAYSRMTMRDINREIIEPCCRQSGKSYALSANPNGLKVDAFITHSWDGIFQDFVQAIRTAFQTSLTKPNLWICAFALIQGDHQLIEQQVGGKDSSLDASPFVNALEHASQFVVVRNSKTDLYSRIWCVCELIFAKAFGLVPHKTHVTGPDQFSQLKTSCLDAQSTEPKDKYRILKFLLNEHLHK